MTETAMTETAMTETESASATETRWLDAAEQQVWRAFLEATLLLDEALETQLRRDSGLSHADYEVLVRLSESPGRQLRMSELADLSLSSRSRLSHAVARLEDKGWVRRTACDGDRRGTLATLTDDGFAVLAEAAHGHVEAVRTLLFDPLTPEQVTQLGEISKAVRAQIAARA